jgi:transposase InsO family protein
VARTLPRTGPSSVPRSAQHPRHRRADRGRHHLGVSLNPVVVGVSQCWSRDPGWCTTPTPVPKAIRQLRVHRAARRSRRPTRPVGSVGDAYDNALAESQIGLYKTELTRPEGPWRGVEHVELETLNWVDWFNTERPHEALSDLTPMAAEELHYAAKNKLMPTG